MNFDGLIFDLDGTLWDCTKVSTDACNLIFERLGVERRVSVDFMRSICGRPTSECDEMLMSGLSDSIREQAVRSLEEVENSLVREYAPRALYEGVREGLGALGERYALYVVSNCGEKYLSVFCEFSTIGGLFKDSESYGRTKRVKAENIRSLVERQALKSPCYIGDTAGDEDAAEKAGVPFFHARYGFGVPKGSPVAFGSFGELSRYFLELA